MAFNQAGSAQVPLSVFGGLVTEMAPSALPEGVSPNCQEGVFAPGSFATRPALEKVFTVPFPAIAGVLPTVMYAKTYNTPAGEIQNLYLDSFGRLWMEDLIASIGTYTLIAQVTPNSFAKSCTAFGAEYIAISDGQHGSDVALQWNGTWIDRVTQDGPGVAPTVACVPLPAVTMAASGASPLVLTITTAQASDYDYDSGLYTTVRYTVTAGALGLQLGQLLTVAGNTSGIYNGPITVLEIISDTLFTVAAINITHPAGTGGTATGTASVTVVRAANAVSVTTATAHSLRPGYQVQISGIAAAVFGTAAWQTGGVVSSIVINNEQQAGVATVTTSLAHGLTPNVQVGITGVSAVTVGTGIAAISWAGGIVTVTTSTANGLTPGASVLISGITGATGFNASGIVISVLSTTTFTYSLAQVAAPPGTPSGGIVQLGWPIPSIGEPVLFTVLTAPTPTTFTVQISYCDGTWTTGTLSFAWNGIFYVLTTPSATTFTYRQYGPPATSTVAGKVTPYGQMAPGVHQCRVSYLTRNGLVTRPSPPVSFTCPGGQYPSVSNICIGPPNVVARILQFTGAGGSYFFYLPVDPQVNGESAGTATQINDNTTTAALLDFGDDSLYASIGTSQGGNDLASLNVIEGALGFGYYASRLITYGQRNVVQNLLNMNFGGYAPNNPNLPAGWTGSTSGTAANVHFGVAWQAPAAAAIQQSAYQDGYGAPILEQNTKYNFRCWAAIHTGAPTVTAAITSATTGFSSTVTLTAPTSGYVEGAFSLVTPASIPDDMVLSITVGGTGSIQLNDLSVIYAQKPYLTTAILSYVNNEESFDGLTGVLGPSDDAHAILDTVAMQAALYLLTQDPGGRLHRTNDNGTTEPSDWPIAQVGANCGVLSAFATAVSQADDSTGSGGEEWFAWASSTQARIYSGDIPWGISQEISPDWIGAKAAGAMQWSDASGINAAAQFAVWAVNDPKTRRIYFGLPTGSHAAPNLVYPMDYRELDTAFQISSAAPIHASYTGRLVATDHTRKWNRWNMTMNGAALMSRAPGSLEIVFFGGNAQAPGAAAGHGNVYTLNAAKYTDDDYGQVYPFYVTYAFVTHDLEQALQLGAVRKTLTFLTAFVAGLGNITITPYPDALSNPWSITGVRPLSADPKYDLNWSPGSASGERMFIGFASSPVTGTDNWFNLQRMMVALRQCARLPVRGTL